ncbi:hypothetical protein TcWFU_005597 [Taenia crassiceps]|uniref:TPX2 C-terminal domain-containing protein n=1 Tax=Taenia crassiceps TaxID=6207 RepID=A0ABR4Q802_9CEST
MSSLHKKDLRLHAGLRFGGPHKATITTPKPFSFASKDIDLLRSRLQRQSAALQESRRLANSFRAQPMPLPIAPILPEPRLATPTSPHSPALKTRCRAARRASFDAHVEARRASAQRQLEAFQREKAKEEAKRLAEERKARVVRAAPVRRQASELTRIFAVGVHKCLGRDRDGWDSKGTQAATYHQASVAQFK